METSSKEILQQAIEFACHEGIYEDFKQHMKGVLTDFEWYYFFNDD